MSIWLTDRLGADVDEVTPTTVVELLDSIIGINESEHGSVSISREDGWGLEFYPDSIVLENVEEASGGARHLDTSDRDFRLAIAWELINEHEEQLAVHDWISSDDNQ